LSSVIKEFVSFIHTQSTIMNWISMRKARPFGFYTPYRYSVDVPVLDESHVIEWLKEKMDDCLPDYLNFVDKAFSFNDRLKEFERENP